MTSEQFDNAYDDLIDRLQTMREAELGINITTSQATTNTKRRDDMDDVYEQPASSERQSAVREFMLYCQITKDSSKYPKKLKPGTISLGSIELGPVEERGDDLNASPPFVTCNLADFIDSTGYFDLVEFLGTNRKSFPYLYKLACCLASLRTNEVGCERFFSTAGYVSNPRRTRLNVGNYEAIAMLKHNIHHVYVNEEWVANQYMTMEKEKSWDSADQYNDNLVASLERELYAEQSGLPLEDLPQEPQEPEVPQDGSDDDAVESHTESEEENDDESTLSDTAGT